MAAQRVFFVAALKMGSTKEMKKSIKWHPVKQRARVHNGNI
jgi:hypothetical protein